MASNKEIMKRFSIAIYPSTFKRMVDHKEKKKWTHDQMINLLIDMSEEKDLKEKKDK